MYNAVVNTFCCTCGKQKKKFKSCVRNHHEFAFEEDITALYNKYITPKRAPQIECEIKPSALCPAHDEEAIGYCINCKRCFCAKDAHFDHKVFLFKDFGIDNNIEVNKDVFDALMNAKRELSELPSKQQELTTINLKMKDDIIKALATALLKVSRTAQKYFIDCLCVISRFTTVDADIRAAMEDITIIDNDIHDLVLSDSVKNVITDMTTFYAIPRKYYNVEVGNGSVAVMTRTHMTVYDGSYSVYNYANVLVADEYPYRAFQIDDKLITMSPNISIFNGTKRYTKNKLLNNEVNYTVTDYMYFINEDHHIVKLNVETMEEVVLDGKYKSIITTYNSKFDIAAIDENDNIMLYDTEWHKYPLKIPFDDIRYYIGTKHNGPGIIASNSMIYRVGGPSIRIYANFIYYDNTIIICKNGFSSIQITF